MTNTDNNIKNPSQTRGFKIKINDIKNIILSSSTSTTIIFLGAPGIGKSYMVRMAAEEEAVRLGRKFVDFATVSDELFSDIIQHPENYYIFIDLRLTRVEPTDLTGIPRTRELRAGETVLRYAEYEPLKHSLVLSVPGIAGMLFLDELTNVQRLDLQALIFELIWDRRLGDRVLSPLVRVVAAGNDPEFSAVASELPSPVISRALVFRVEPPSVNEWISFMSSAYNEGEWTREIAAFLSRFPEYFIATSIPPSTLSPYPCPRSWTLLATTLPRMPRELWGAIVVAAVGEDVARLFMTFLDKSAEVPPVEEILKNPQVLKSLSLDALYLASLQLMQSFNIADNRFITVFEVLVDVKRDVLVATLLSLPPKRREMVAVALSRSEKLRRIMLEMGSLLREVR
ncbi:MAG: ATP-binding protein [Infirmifilum sp.]